MSNTHSPQTREKLRGISTATIASALCKRGLRNQMIQGAVPLRPPKGGSMVGFACTLRCIPARPRSLMRLPTRRSR